MLLSFSVTNFKSFRDTQVLDLRASAKQPAFSWLEHAAVPVGKGESALRVKALYGANASGKSNMIEAMRVGINLTLKSAMEPFAISILTPFAFAAEADNKPITFEWEFTTQGRQYRYGISADKQGIHREWMYDETVRRAKVFVREGQRVEVGKSYFDRLDAVELLKSPDNQVFRKDSSFVSALGTFSVGGSAQNAIAFLHKILVIEDIESSYVQQYAYEALTNNRLRSKTKELLSFSGIDVGNLVVIDADALDQASHPAGFIKMIQSTNKRFNPLAVYSVEHQAEPKGWLAEHNESQGTQKMLVLAPLIIQAIQQGRTFIIDEFEAKLHTKLSREIVQLFNSKVGNPNNAQFIFSTHDTNLLDHKLLRRDQIDFVEKGADRASEIYSLADITGTRKEDDFERDYLDGSYGAVPNVTDFNIAILEDRDGEEK